MRAETKEESRGANTGGTVALFEREKGERGVSGWETRERGGKRR